MWKTQQKWLSKKYIWILESGNKSICMTKEKDSQTS